MSPVLIIVLTAMTPPLVIRVTTICTQPLPMTRALQYALMDTMEVTLTTVKSVMSLVQFVVDHPLLSVANVLQEFTSLD